MKIVSLSIQAFPSFRCCYSHRGKVNISWICSYYYVVNNCWWKIISAGALETKYNYHNLQNQHTSFYQRMMMRFSDDLICMVLPRLFDFFCSIAEVYARSSPFIFSGDPPDINIITFNGDSFSHPTVPTSSVAFCLCHSSPHSKEWETQWKQVTLVSVVY